MKPTVLIVDDEPLIADLIGKILERAIGAAVQIACDCNTGFKLLKQSPHPDLIISDYNRPGDSGFDFLVAIKGNPLMERISVAIIWASPNISDSGAGVI
jgi:CheY-like chemotaxis protein